MEISETLIQKFFDLECTEEEAKVVRAYFYENPELLDAYFNEEWQQSELSEIESTQLKNNITKHISKDSFRIRRIRTWSVAAAAVVLGAALMLTIRGISKRSFYASVKSHQVTGPKWMEENNTSDKTKALYLLDGSLVELQPGSAIRYLPFDKSDNRAVYLKGTAFFRVAKNPDKPFIVYARELETRVLGTQFAVRDTANKMIIALHEGKVSVKPVQPLGKWEKPVYLKPGQTLMFDRDIASFKVTTASSPTRHLPEDAAQRDTLNSWMGGNGNSWYMFNNQSLSTVFDQLEELYNIRIIYNRADVKNVYFIGKFEKTDSVQDILDNIALLKKLQIRHQGNTYIITKRKH